MTTKLEDLTEELLKLLRKNPDGPNAGMLAEAVAHLTVVQSSHAKEGALWTRFGEEIPKLLADFEEKISTRQAERQLQAEAKEKQREAEKNKPPTPLSDAERQASLEKAIAQNIGQAVARDLIQEATVLELQAATGRVSREFGKFAEGEPGPKSLDEGSQQLSKQQAAVLRARAVQVLLQAGCDCEGGYLALRPY